MPILNHLWIILALPLAGAAINGLFGKRWPKSAVNSVAIGSVSLAFLAVAELVREFWQLSPSQIPYIGDYFTWIVAGPFRVDFSLQVDQLTVVMLLVVSFVGMLIHIYSTGYMAHEGGYYRFFSYLNLFMFFMLTLVLAANLIVMFVGWEGVGLCSYLLIGFWFLKKSAADAGKKAFITTRIGDFGFTVGILLHLWHVRLARFSDDLQERRRKPGFGSHPDRDLHPALHRRHRQIGAVAALRLAAGRDGRPHARQRADPRRHHGHRRRLHGRAHESALFARAHRDARRRDRRRVTAFYSATIGLMQTDIKKVLAYSTVSQLGYMFLGCGVGAYAAGIFHLMTHAFFKGLLFLCAGSVIHAMGGEQDMRKMGGLRKKIPVTYWTMLIATLAIAGIPGFAGFFSKDEILEAAQSGPHANLSLWLLGVAGAGLTSFYMFRLIFLTFFGKPRYDEHQVHVHESPKNMTIPLMILAFLSVFGGWFAAPQLIGGIDHFGEFLQPVFTMYAPTAAAVAPESAASPGLALFHALTGWPVIVGILGLLVAWWFYIKSPETPKRLAKSLHGLYTLIFHKYYVDEIYAALIVRPLLWISDNVLWHVVDEGVIDGTVNGVATVARESGGEVRKLQSGNTRSYASWVVIGAVGFTFLLLLVLGMR